MCVCVCVHMHTHIVLCEIQVALTWECLKDEELWSMFIVRPPKTAHTVLESEFPHYLGGILAKNILTWI